MRFEIRCTGRCLCVCDLFPPLPLKSLSFNPFSPPSLPRSMTLSVSLAAAGRHTLDVFNDLLAAAQFRLRRRRVGFATLIVLDDSFVCLLALVYAVVLRSSPLRRQCVRMHVRGRFKIIKACLRLSQKQLSRGAVS